MQQSELSGSAVGDEFCSEVAPEMRSHSKISIDVPLELIVDALAQVHNYTGERSSGERQRQWSAVGASIDIDVGTDDGFFRHLEGAVSSTTQFERSEL